MLLVQAVTMDQVDGPACGRVCQPMRFKPDAGVVLPERPTPAVVIATDQGDRDVTRNRGQRRGNPKTATRNQPAIAEPVVEDVAGEEQRITGEGHLIQKGEERRFVGCGSRAEVRIGDNHESGIFHGAKGAE